MTFILERKRLESICDEVLALYSVYKDSKFLRVHAAKLNGNEEVRPEPIDFIIDVELKAERFLEGEKLAEWYTITQDPDSYLKLPLRTKQALGEIFEQHHLGVDGHYRFLYGKAKRDMDCKIAWEKEISEIEYPDSERNDLDPD